MKYKRTLQKSVFMSSLLEGLTSVGHLYTTQFNPPKYEDYYGSDSDRYDHDLEMIGKDMWCAIGVIDDEMEKEEPTAST